ncbi:MAG TPA: SDR family oxidoreductase [Cyclobacteriaceae bacterium]|nr:SDR family oxidoreductase [Cyclobacteriaceae bacterium]
MKDVLIVTGAGRGIGAATVEIAAEKGYSVCINYRNNIVAAETLAQSIIARGGEALAVCADISDEDDIVRMFDTVDRYLGPVTALVNNAAILPPPMPVNEMDYSRLRKVFDTNIIGPFICAREAVKRMSTLNGGKGGAIVNVSSIVAKYGSPNEVNDYAASKAAIDMLTIGLAREVASEGIRVNGVRPSLVYTDMILEAEGNADRFERVKQIHPMKRAGYTEEVANAILWLLSDEASYTAGAIIDVNGGR